MDTPERTAVRRPEWIAVKTFAAAILVGTALLTTPYATKRGDWQDPLAALFTATSATCVTGLTVVDTGSDLSLFGQIVVLALIQLGGLGIMTLGTFLLVLTGRRLRMQDEFILMDSLGTEGVRGLRSLLARTVLFTVALETVSASILAHRFISAHGYSPTEAVYHGVFHSISAFCNAGFSLYSSSLMGLRTDRTVVLVITCLIVLGGVGFLVLYNVSSLKIWRRDRLSRGKLTLHSKIVLASSAALIALGTLAFLLLESDRTLLALSWPDRLLCSVFQAVTPRTAGFNVVDMADVEPATSFLSMVLMFIGGSPASTAGGIKTTTLIVLALTVVTMVRGREDTELYHRAVPIKIVREALSIFLLSLLCILVFFFILLVSEEPDATGCTGPATTDLLFETVSAFGTVGLSTGITPDLSAGGKLALVLCMFVGRLGPLTMALIIGGRDLSPTAVRFPEEEVVVG